MKAQLLSLLFLGIFFSGCRKAVETPVENPSAENALVQQAKIFTAGALSSSDYHSLDFSKAQVFYQKEQPALIKIPASGKEALYLKTGNNNFIGAWATIYREHNRISSVNSQSLNRQTEVLVSIAGNAVESVSLLKGTPTPAMAKFTQGRIVVGPPVIITLSFDQLLLVQLLGIGQPGWYGGNNGDLNNFDYILSGDQFYGNSILDGMGVLVQPETYNLTPTDYPGMNDGFPWLWWENEAWLDDHFSLGVDADPVYGQLTADEKRLVKIYPLTAYIMYKNMSKAMTECALRFPNENGLNDKRDAFRHAYFHAINFSSVLTDKVGVMLLAFAHESEVPLHLSKEKSMDILNNAVGFDTGSIFDSNATTSDKIMAKLLNGQLWYLSPINYNDIYYDRMPDNTAPGTHGITVLTHLTPTNQ
jgi:hypothetical protein